MQIFLLGLLTLMLLMPVGAGALTAEELTAQINTLLKQVEELQKQVGAGPATNTTTTTAIGSGTIVNPSTVQCPLISRNLKKGMSGADVTRLQRFLALDPSVYPEAQVSGYYGALTEAAVKRFQCKNKLVCEGTPESTGYGVTGPRTAALLALQCPDVLGGANVSGFIKITPTAGNAPLTVAIEVIANTIKACSSASYELIYGDNSSSGFLTVPANTCNEVRQTFNHLYTGAGTFTVVLRSGVHQVTGTVNVTGGGGGTSQPTNSTLFSGTPTSGAAPLNVTFSGTLNNGGTCYAGEYKIQFGDGNFTTVLAPSCSPSTYSVMHTYQSGNFVAGLYRGSEQLVTVPITAGSGSSGSQGGGQFTVTAGATGDPFTVTAAFDVGSSCARYDVDWGDGTTHAIQAEGSCGSGTVSKTVNHTYQSGGIYTITLKRGASLSSTDTVALTIVQ